jgi:hypothetical protein
LRRLDGFFASCEADETLIKAMALAEFHLCFRPREYSLDLAGDVNPKACDAAETVDRGHWLRSG